VYTAAASLSATARWSFDGAVTAWAPPSPLPAAAAAFVGALGGGAAAALASAGAGTGGSLLPTFLPADTAPGWAASGLPSPPLFVHSPPAGGALAASPAAGATALTPLSLSSSGWATADEKALSREAEAPSGSALAAALLAGAPLPDALTSALA
jgi:hypothetical protein